MKLCAVQFRPRAGDVLHNRARHLELVEAAAGEGAGLVFFPELSLTGYEPSLAAALATDAEDPVLSVFQEQADRLGILTGLGMPLRGNDGIRIGMVWFSPSSPRRTYAKQFLHADELPYFVPGDRPLLIEADPLRLAPAICYESLQIEHAREASDLGAGVYLASVAKPAGGMARASTHYPSIARTFGMSVLLSNCTGPCDNFTSVGQSAVWDAQGNRLVQMDDCSDGLVFYDPETGEATIRLLGDI